MYRPHSQHVERTIQWFSRESGESSNRCTFDLYIFEKWIWRSLGNKKELIKRDDLKFDFKDVYRIFMEEEVFFYLGEESLFWLYSIIRRRKKWSRNWIQLSEKYLLLSFCRGVESKKRGQVLFKKRGGTKRMMRKKRRPFFSLSLSSPFLVPFVLFLSRIS